jgi:hypothetical protein
MDFTLSLAATPDRGREHVQAIWALDIMNKQYKTITYENQDGARGDAEKAANWE